MRRRSFLLAVGAVAALSLTAHFARRAWVATGTAYPRTGGLTEAQLVLVSAVGDTIIPRTDTPSATDVGVPAWIDLMVAEHYSSAERAVFVGGLDAIDALALDTTGTRFAMGSLEHRERVLAILDRPTAYERFVVRLARSRRFARAMTHVIDHDDLARIMTAPAQRARAYLQLKELVVHGYFTSEHVHEEVLRAGFMPGRFDGAAPVQSAVPVDGA